MPTLSFQGLSVQCAPDETVLEALHRQGLATPSSCRTGVCQTCLMRATAGSPPPSSQIGLKDSLVAQGYFLACICKPADDMTVSLPDESAVQRARAAVVSREMLNQDILRLRLSPDDAFHYYAGQFLQIHRPDGLIRSYSIASVPAIDSLIELHIRLLPGGSMTTWIHQEVREKDSLEISGANGNCFYTGGDPTQGILLIGTGSGLAPLWGVARAALHEGHQGEIRLYHGSWNAAGLYLRDELSALAAQYPNFHYHPCIDEGDEEACDIGRADKVALTRHASLSNWRVYLCGHPEMVKSAKRGAFLAGANLSDIYADPFVLSKSP